MTGRPVAPAEPRGRLIALEGIDGCGKSTQAARLATRLEAVGTWEPGATALGRSLRQLLLDGRVEPTARAEALMMVADRAQHVAEVIEPALESGRWVVTERFSGSTLAYQGWGRGLPTDGLRQITSWASGGLSADLSVLIDVPVTLARRRLESGRIDRFEALDPDFHQRVRDGYVALAETYPEEWAVVDGTGPVDEVTRLVSEVVQERLGRP